MKRREFLTQSVITGAAGVLAPAVAFAAAPTRVGGVSSLAPAALPATKRMSKAWFEQFLDEPFRFEREGSQPVTARLVTVQAQPVSKQVEQFSAAFRVVDGGDGLGGLYSVEHAVAGRFQLLLSPSADQGPRQTWYAHFSLLK